MKKTDDLSPLKEFKDALRFHSQINLEKVKKLKSSLVIRSRWSNKRNKFLKTEILKYNTMLQKEQFVSLIKVVKILNYHSGVKKRSCALTTFLLFCTAIFGFIAASFFLQEGFIKLAGILFVITPLVSFFFVIGYGMMKGDQFDRFNNFIENENCKIHLILRKAGFRLSNSISKCNNFFQNFFSKNFLIIFFR